MEPTTAGRELPRYPIESVDNALRLLSLFVSEEQIRVKDAAELLGVATGTAHRVLSMLLYRGYVSQDPGSKAYVPGPMLLSVGLKAASRLDLPSQARPYLEELNAELDETVHVCVLRGTETLYLDGIESKKVLRVGSRAGTIHPAHCTSAGKAMLASMPKLALMQLYRHEELPQVTGRSIGSRTQLLIELESTKARGYATNFGELEEGIGSIAVPVADSNGNVVAAIAIGAPAARLGEDRLAQMADAAGQCAIELGASLYPR